MDGLERVKLGSCFLFEVNKSFSGTFEVFGFYILKLLFTVFTIFTVLFFLILDEIEPGIEICLFYTFFDGGAVLIEFFIKRI